MHDDIDQPQELNCPHCGYNVAIIPADRCPECGRTFRRSELIRQRSRIGDRPRMWRPLTLILAMPIACGSLLVLMNFAVAMLGGAITAPALAVMLIACVIASLAASNELIACLHARGIGMAWQVNNLKTLVVVLCAAVQMMILAGAVAVTLLLANL